MTISNFTNQFYHELMHSIAIIITTYNRPDKIAFLLDQLLAIERGICEILIVDSSVIPVREVLPGEKVKYIYSTHKNQPYQRYLGYLTSEADILVFMDDDMEIQDFGFIDKIAKLFNEKNLTGIALKFENKNELTSLSAIPASIFNSTIGVLKKLKCIITGYPILSNGKLGLCGSRGLQPQGGGSTEWLSGGAFAARRSVMFQNFNFQLFDIFEHGLGMGEDGIIGYGLSKQGKLIWHDELFFLHNDQKDSTYIKSVESFSRKVAYSRLFLSLEKTRLDKGSLLLARIHYHYYMFWRVMGLLLNFAINPSKERKESLLGTLTGWRMAFFFRFDKRLRRQEYWHNEAMKDLERNELQHRRVI